MRIVILSIALLFCAFSAHSQVLKSAGVWYFLDVDSMTARPAVLPNGTELAYVIGTKKIYYWDRGTSTWTEYSTGSGSTFNRDSIYFDSSIVGSGTVGDPWGVDSTLFATIAAVGDSIAAAVANYFPLEGGTLTGTGGAGFIGFPSQVTAPGTPASGLNVYAQGSSFNWKGTDGYERQITSTLTGGHSYDLPNVNGTFALGTGTADRSARWSATNTLAAGNFTDNGTKVQALLPFQFQTYTTAGLPTGVTGYHVYNTTTNGPGWYQGSRWAYGLESTFNRGTSTRVPFFNANGQITDNSLLTYTSATGVLKTTNYTFNEAPGIILDPFGTSELALIMPTNGNLTIFSNGGSIIPFYTNQKLGGINNRWEIAYIDRYVSTVAGTPSTPMLTYRVLGNNIPAGMYFVGDFANHDVGFSTNAQTRFYMTYAGLVGINTTSPTQDFDINGDLRVRDSTRLTTTPAHSAITGLLTRNTDGWVGLASLAGGLIYSDGVLSASGVNTVYTASDSIRGDRYLEMANDGISTTALGYFPSFPGYSFGDNSYGLYISPDYGGEVSLMFNKNGITKQFAMSGDNAGISVEKGGRSANITARLGAVELTAQGVSTTNKYWNIVLDSVKLEVQRNISGTLRTYNLLPASEYPSTTSAAKTVLQWTGDGTNANPAFVDVKRDTTIYVTDADYNFGTTISSANVLLRYNRVFIYSKLTASATSDNQIILPSASTDFLQCSIYVYSNDASADADATSVDFTTNGAIDGAGGTLSSYALTGGQQILIRPTNDGGYKWFFN